MTQHSRPAIALARACDEPARMPFVLSNEQGPVQGSVASRHLDALRERPDAFEVLQAADGAARTLVLRLPAPGRDARLAQIHARLRADGLIVAWRDEPYPLRDRTGAEHGTLERAASRFRGMLTLDFAVRRGLLEPESSARESTVAVPTSAPTASARGAASAVARGVVGAWRPELPFKANEARRQSR